MKKILSKTTTILIAILISLVSVVTLSLTSCSSKNNEGNITITDVEGYELTIEKPVERIVCIWPSGSQLLITLGLGDLLVGVSNDTKEQSWAKYMYPRLSEIPGCDYKESAEQIYTLNPDIVLTSEASVAVSLREKGLRAITFSYYSIEEMNLTISALSKIVPDKYSKQLTNYLTYINNNISTVKSAFENKSFAKEMLYYINGNNNKGLTKTAGANTMNEEWALKAYCDFATSTLLTSSETVVDEEAILFKNPTIIIIGGRYQHVLKSSLENNNKWSSVSAVANGKIFTAPLGISPFDRFGAEIAIMIPWVASVAYPDILQYDLAEEIKSFYSTFTNFNLSDNEVQYIINGLMPDGTQEF